MPKFKAGDIIGYGKTKWTAEILYVGTWAYLTNALTSVEGEPYLNVRETLIKFCYYDTAEHHIYTPPPEPTVLEAYFHVWKGNETPYIRGGVRGRQLASEKMSDCLASILVVYSNKNDGSDPEVKATLVYTKP